MTPYKHTQIGYLTIFITLVVTTFFIWIYTTALAETPSVDSGPNLAVSAVMLLIIFTLVSFTTLTTSIDKDYIQVKFSYGIYVKKFELSQIASVKIVKNHWYYGWGIRFWLRPRMCIYNVSGFDAVELTMKDGKIYRIGTDAPSELEAAINSRLI